MRFFVFIILAGYAVKCDDASYYVIEIPEEVPREFTKPFRVYWNVPTMQCKSKKIPFEDLYEKYGIIQNSGDSFRGDKVSILYDPGLFPALLKNETSGKFVFRNGGVPQEGNMDKHLGAFKTAVVQQIPDEGFNGIGIIDFESWRPTFRQNWGVLTPYKDFSYQIERDLHWFWTEKAIKARAQRRFEQSARAFMQTTISIAKQLRPRALWGYYGFPYCYNMASNNMVESCSSAVRQENDKIYWLWSESTALYPSIYSSNELTSSQLGAMIRGRIAEAARSKRKGTPVLPYFWFRYREGGYLSQTDLNVVLETLYKSDASGFIIWGGSSDVNTVDKCENLLKYTTEVLGPAIAKYTKTYGTRNATDDSGTTSNPVSNSVGLTTWRSVLKDHLDNSNSSKKPVFLDPEYHWEPPENYSQDIAHYVQQEFKKKPNYNGLKDSQTGLLANKKEISLLEMMLNIFRNNKEEMEDTKPEKDVVLVKDDEDRSSQIVHIATSTVTVKDHNIERSTSPTSIVTKNPLDTLKKNPQSTEPSEMNSDVFLSSTINFNNYVSSTPGYYTTKDYASITQRENQSSEKFPYENHDVINYQENVTTRKPSIGENLKNNDNEKQLSEVINVTNKLDIKDNIESSTVGNLSTEGVTSTSHEYTMPLNDKLEDNLITIVHAEFLENGHKDTTVDFIENISSSYIPDSTEKSTLGLDNENKPIDSLKEDLIPYRSYFNLIESGTIDTQYSESTTKKELEIFDYIFDTDPTETSTENIAVTNIVEKIETTPSSDIFEREIKNSTNNNSTATVKSSTSVTERTEEFVINNNENVPDSIIGDFGLETSTVDELASTTNEPQVVVFL